jgi:hypothetical protein
MPEETPTLWSEAWWQQALRYRAQGRGWKTVCEQDLHMKYGGTFTGRLKEARLLRWIPAEEDLPPAIRSDGKRVGLPASGARPVQKPVQTSGHHKDTGAVLSVDTGAVQTFDTGAVQRLDRLEGEVQGLTQVVRSLVDRLNSTPVQAPVQITTLPPFPKGKAVRWNIWILDAIQDELKTLATERDVSPSQLVQELLWTALTERRRPPERESP